MIPLSRELTNVEHLVVTQDDIYKRLQAPPDEFFDVILIDVDHSPDERLDDIDTSFYTSPGLIAARRHLAADGVLAVWSYAESSPFADALHSVFSQVTVKPITHHNELVDEHLTDWLFLARG